MIQLRGCYVKYGEVAALKSLVPGWGQFHNKHYLKGVLFQIIFALAIFSLIYVVVVQVGTGTETSKARAGILLALLLAWEVALFDSYHFAIENRRRDAKRFNVEVATLVHGPDLQQQEFEEVALTKNLSKLGVCLVLSSKVEIGSELDLEFQGKLKTRGRVVWQRETGNHGQYLVGLELLTPLQESSLIEIVGA
jgi:PilZ domain